MDDRIVLVEDLLRELAKPLKARLRPAVTLVGYVLHKQRQRLLVAAASRYLYGLLTVRGPEVAEECLGVRRRPLPGIGVGELRQVPDQRDPRLDRPLFLQEPGLLLPRPASEHGIEQCRLRVQVDDAVHQFQTCRTGQVCTLSQRNFFASDTSLLRGCIADTGLLSCLSKDEAVSLI